MNLIFSIAPGGATGALLSHFMAGALLTGSLAGRVVT
jgi:hypothetical protein